MSDISTGFGSLVFNDRVMKERLSENAYSQLHRTLNGRSPKKIIESKELADEIAEAMKKWAVEKGATHYTHWFQPLNSFTAEKHESFLTPCKDGGALITFSGKELIKGESDASSFPSGGLRSTFEARGYTAWDPTSFAFIKDNTLCIPTVFCSYGGEALDKKTPLMRSSQALNTQLIRLLRLLGDAETSQTFVNVGAEQEYFLIDKSLYDRRTDLKFTGRTLIGAKPPKGQELEDHYYGALKPRVREFMRDLNKELWSMGICAKTEHNEVAPSQHELAPLFSVVNTATDQNQLMMECMKKTALKHGFVCVLHEKPFLWVNGSGKHNNWSVSTDKGQNLLEPGDTPEENARFLLFLAAVIAAVDDYQDLLRISVSGAENDCRLGSNEAPPAIVSVYLGDELNSILDNIPDNFSTVFHTSDAGRLETKVHVLPKLPKDSTDRNRTSPFAFTGNKFEFRMPGSSGSIADPNTVINTIVAESVSVIADKIEENPHGISEIIRETIESHRRILFNGNNYTESWVKEAEKRGLLNLPSTADAVPLLLSKKNLDLFSRHQVFTENEIRSRCEIQLEEYVKKINIETAAMTEMVSSELLPAAVSYCNELKPLCGMSKQIEHDLSEIVSLYDSCRINTEILKEKSAEIAGIQDPEEKALHAKNKVLVQMAVLRSYADKLESVLPKRAIPYPTYGELLFSE